MIDAKLYLSQREQLRKIAAELVKYGQARTHEVYTGIGGVFEEPDHEWDWTIEELERLEEHINKNEGAGG